MRYEFDDLEEFIGKAERCKASDIGIKLIYTPEQLPNPELVRVHAFIICTSGTKDDYFYHQIHVGSQDVVPGKPASTLESKVQTEKDKVFTTTRSKANKINVFDGKVLPLLPSS